jgi:hypothetical protein
MAFELQEYWVCLQIVWGDVLDEEKRGPRAYLLHLPPKVTKVHRGREHAAKLKGASWKKEV